MAVEPAGVGTVGCGVVGQQVEAREAFADRQLLKGFHQHRQIWNVGGLENGQHRAPVDPDVILTLEVRQVRVEVAPVVVAPQVMLSLQQASVALVQPVMVRPCEAVAHLQVQIEHQLRGRFQQSLSIAEPVIPDQEAADAMRAGDTVLQLDGIAAQQAVFPKGRNRPTDALPAVMGSSILQVAPFGESGAPPGVIFRNDMKLRQVVGEAERRVWHGVRGSQFPVPVWTGTCGAGAPLTPQRCALLSCAP